jgi:uncharacterized protein YehS (DUF1456 family)
MENNTILRRIRYIFDYGDDKMIKIFSLGGRDTDRAEVSDWLKSEKDDAFKPIFDKDLAHFLNGFISEKRGVKEGAEPAIAEKSLNNNLILRKLKIALAAKDTDMVAILKKADFNIGKSELNAFFRKPGQEKYRKCHDQILRNFLIGMQLTYRPKDKKTNNK